MSGSPFSPRPGKQYHPARLVLFSSAVRTGCGDETAEVGPFYCPADQTVYLDVPFFKDMEAKYGVKGDFSQAYVVAHELGPSHPEHPGGQRPGGPAEPAVPGPGQRAVRSGTELQADCYAGVWAHSAYTRSLLEPGDLDEALTAAATVGDDFLQKSATGSVQPEKWTHGILGPAAEVADHRLRQGRAVGLRHVRRDQPLGSPYEGGGSR